MPRVIRLVRMESRAVGAPSAQGERMPSQVLAKDCGNPTWLTPCLAWATLNLHRNLSAKLLLSACYHLLFHHDHPHIPLSPSSARPVTASLLFVQHSSHSDLLIVARRRTWLLCCRCKTPQHSNSSAAKPRPPRR